jgi:hypothetical protein
VRTPMLGVLVLCLAGETSAIAGERPILDAGIRAIAQAAARADAVRADPTPPQPPRSGHPVLVGTVVGAAVGAVVAAATTSCSAEPSPIDPAPCGRHPRAGAAVIGGAFGAGVGALVGLAVKAVRH